MPVPIFLPFLVLDFLFKQLLSPFLLQSSATAQSKLHFREFANALEPLSFKVCCQGTVPIFFQLKKKKICLLESQSENMTSLLMFFWENIVAFSQVLLTCKQSLFSWSEWCSQSLEEIIAWQVRNATDALLSGKQGSQQRSPQLKGSIITLISDQGQCVA